MTGRRNPLTMLGELQGYLLGVVVVLCMVATAVVFLPQPQKANAFVGRNEKTGYFFNKLDTTDGDKVIYNGGDINYPRGKGLTGVNSVDSFVAAIKWFLNDTTIDSPMSPTGNTSNRTGAAFIILDMLGYPPGTLISTADTEFDRWATAIRRVANNPATPIYWNQQFTYTINTFWQNDGNGTTGDIAWYNTTAQSAPSIVIPWTGGGLYAIKIDCANPVGNVNRTWGEPFELMAEHVDENNALMTSGSFANNISCTNGSCATNRSGNKYSITLDPNGYTVSNFSAAPGYTYTGYTYTGFFDVREGTGNTVNFSANSLNNAPKITWKYRKNPGQNCTPPSKTLGIGETFTLNSTIVSASYAWYAGFSSLPNNGTGPTFTVSYNAVANYPVTLTTAGGVVSTCYVIVTQKPYIRAYGGDIFAGSSPSCAGWNASNFNSGIYGFTGPPVGAGSGAQLGVLAMGQVWGFNSAMLRALAPIPPNGLTFGNTTSLGDLAVSHCPHDYWAEKDKVVPTTVTPGVDGIISPGSYPTGNYYVNHPTTVITSANVSNGGIINLYVKGNLVIQNNIKYVALPSWGSATDIPRLQIIVTGNIYIHKNVTQLDGIYVAQGGTIYTCANDAVVVTSVNLYNDCNKQLTVNGALLATKIKWLRTLGHLSNSIAGENPLSVGRDCTSSGPTFNNPVCASEVVILGPEAWMVQPSSINPTANYVQALPPLL